jgi:hypothetical protein
LIYRDAKTTVSANAVFIVALFVGTILIVVIPIEAGYRLGLKAPFRQQPKAGDSVSLVATAMLGLLAFMLAFTFGFAANRFDTRIQLVRSEANAIRTAWARADFLPPADRDETRLLLHGYLRARIGAVAEANPENLKRVVADAENVQRRLWEIALPNARKDLNSDIGALYIESLNEIAEMHASRAAVALGSRTPPGVWLTLAGVTALAMAAAGYSFGLAGSERTIVIPLMALAFALVVALIGVLDRPVAGFAIVSQRPLEDLLSSIEVTTPGSNVQRSVRAK